MFLRTIIVYAIIIYTFPLVYIVCLSQINEEIQPYMYQRPINLRNTNSEGDPLASAMKFHRSTSNSSSNVVSSSSTTRRTSFLKGSSNSSNIFRPLPQDIYRKKFKLNTVTQSMIPNRREDLETNVDKENHIEDKQPKNVTFNCNCTDTNDSGAYPCSSSAATVSSVQIPSTEVDLPVNHQEQDLVINNYTVSIGIGSASEEIEEVATMLRNNESTSLEQQREVTERVNLSQNDNPIRNDDPIWIDGPIGSGDPIQNDDPTIKNEPKSQNSTIKDKYTVDSLSNWLSLFVLLKDRGFGEEVTHDTLKAVHKGVDGKKRNIYNNIYKNTKNKTVMKL